MSDDRSQELFALDADGIKQDAQLHAPMLDNAEADEEEALEAVLTAMAEDGMSEEDALDLYGTKNTADRLAAKRDAEG